MIDITLDLIMQERPSSIRNSLMIGILQGISIVLSFALFFFAIGCFMNAFGLLTILDFLIGNEKFEVITSDEEQVKYLIIAIAVVSLLLSLFFGLVVRLCKMIIKRNVFILDVETWYTGLKDKLTNPQNESVDMQQKVGR